MSDGEAILRQYIFLTYHCSEFRVPLHPPARTNIFSDQLQAITPMHYAIYTPTGRGPFRDQDGIEVWEYERRDVEVKP